MCFCSGTSVHAKDNTEQTVLKDTLPLDDERRYRWGEIEYQGKPWVDNVSRPFSIKHGLYNHHISLWASHGRFYDQRKNEWRWQRPKLYGTTEDLFTQTIVVPYLMPMLENAGAVLFTPRERDWQKHEVIVDNDDITGGGRYTEIIGRHKWQHTVNKGFARHFGVYRDLENPFTAGTARKAETTDDEVRESAVSYQPTIPEDGRYAVYVSYQTLENSIDDAQYTVWHKGEQTTFHVNQQMGGGTWVYLGTFDFAKGNSPANRVIVSNYSKSKGVVTTDAVRFGGGMGNIERFGRISGLPRCLEAARYYAQWAGMPDSIYSMTEGTHDYNDDLGVRSLMTNYIGGGSCYMPTLPGLKVPLELSLAIHSDAGLPKNDSLTSTLAICYTKFEDGLLDAGISRFASMELANDLLETVTNDLKATYGDWYHRGVLDRNYSEVRRPAVPSVILETLSHQNFLDMRMAQDPNFRFTMARAIYKTVLRHIAKQHGKECVVTPLAPDNARIVALGKGKVRISWDKTIDPLEESAMPTGYVVYTSAGDNAFDNGTYVERNSLTLDLIPNVLYNFRITAVNDGGESFPTETLSTTFNPNAEKTILIVNGFHRLSSPAILDRDSLLGFDFDRDPGITYGPTYGWVGRQEVFDKGMTDESLEFFTGWSNDDFTGKFIAGNDRNYIVSHARAIHALDKYNIISCSSHFIDNHTHKTVNRYLDDCDLVDLLLGLEQNDGRSLVRYKTFSPNMQAALEKYAGKGKPLLISGAYVGSDMMESNEQKFVADVLKCQFAGTYRMASNTIKGMGTKMEFHHHIGEQHYAALSPDIIQPTQDSFAMLLYGNGNSAGVAYQGKDYRAIVLGFPFECIIGEKKRSAIMNGMLQFLLPR